MEFSKISNPFNYKAHYNTKIKAYYKPLSQVVTIIQPQHGTIQVLYKNVYYNESFVIKKSDSIKIYFSPNDGYIQSKLLMNNQSVMIDKEYTINEDVTITAEAVIKAYTVNITQIDGVILTVTKNHKEEHVSTFYANYNDILDISYELLEDSIIPNFRLNNELITLPKTIIVDKDIDLVVSSEIKQLHVKLVQSLNSTLKCIYNNTEYSDNFIINYGDKIKPIIIIDNGYHLTELLANNKSISNNVEIPVTEDTVISSIVDINKHSVIIQQPEFGKITAKYHENNYEQSFQIDHGDYASFTCIINQEFIDKYYVRELKLNGEKIKQNTDYQFNDAGLISADIAKVEIIKTYKVFLPEIKGAIVYASYNNKIYTNNFNAIEGYPITIWIEAEPQYDITSFKYNEVSISFTERYTFNINNDVVISASVRLKTYRVKLINTNGGKLKVIMNNKTYTSDFDIIWGTDIQIYVDLDNAYNLTSITLNGTQIADGSSHTIKKNSEIKFTTALKKYEVRVVQPANGKITVNGSVGTSFTFTHGTEITVAISPNSGYIVKSFTMTDL